MVSEPPVDSPLSLALLPPLEVPASFALAPPDAAAFLAGSLSLLQAAVVTAARATATNICVDTRKAVFMTGSVPRVSLDIPDDVDLSAGDLGSECCLSRKGELLQRRNIVEVEISVGCLQL